MGLSRFELLTPRLSSVCSNQLSYRPNTSDPCPDPGPIFRTRNVRQGRLAAPSADCSEGALERWADSLKTRQNVNKPSLPKRSPEGPVFNQYQIDLRSSRPQSKSALERR